MSSICLPPMVPNPNLDCLDLHRAFKGLGCDAEEVIRILAHRNASQRAQIRMVYKNMFEEDICKRLKRELHYHFEKAMLMWMREAPERDARILRGALKTSNGLRRNRILAEVFSTKRMDDVNSIAKAYHFLNGRPLQDDIEATLSGSCQKLFVQYLCGTRDEAADLEPHFALEDAWKLHNALFTHIDDTTAIHILTSRSQRQLRRIFDAYRTTHGQEAFEVINQMDGRCKNEFHTTVMMIAKCVSSPEEYFSEVLYKSMKGLGTDDDTLIRVVVTHAEIDLANIKAAFSRRYKKPLSAMVHSDTTNNYRKFLLALIGVP
ncbi:hypothetical protein GOP47_0006464 [Adiantum capillus-veneris]|uniref:Annexin n=1 Tax=Adiantum capillus-veneris TaxID=13818 RepID=A0A9D4V350_ADICA|nr:hypothetical protein GOP47_0006464 [Adiantum capillus-veneris]